MAGFVFAIDPEQLATRFGGEDPSLAALIDGHASDPEGDEPVDRRVAELIVPLLDKLPPREADIVELYFIHRKKQVDIGYLTGMSQAGVSYRLKRAAQRMRFLLSIPQLTDAEVETTLGVYFDEQELNQRHAYRATTCQSRTAEVMGLTQGQVRGRLFKYLKMLQRWGASDPALGDVTRLFTMLIERHNVLHEVLLPQWQNRGPGEHDGTFG